MRRLFHILMILIAGSLAASAQTEPVLTQYFQAPTFFNPAAAGGTDYMRLRFGSRMQWVGIDGAPSDFIITADSPFKIFNRRFGAGLTMFQESIGLYSTLNLGAQVALTQPLSKKKPKRGFITAAVQVGYINQKFKGSEVFIPDDDDFHESTDESIPTSDVAGDALDISVGLQYTHPRFSAGLSCTHINAPAVKMKSESSTGSTGSPGEQYYEFKFSRTLYFTAESNIPIKNTLFEVLPSLLLRSDFNRVQADITARLRWKKFLTAGIGYRTQDAVSVMLQADYKGFTIAYSYDYATSAIMRASSGSHEIWAGYSLKLDFSEKNRNRHKSIRLM
ncbi:MAG: PorP/SprF family type IX secretion system membrane protein [Muribaculaceae bacterium]|nr:PorP/SprF family type IX secretion system membrane protein [Muribaculaceae bacterium]